MLLSLRFEKWEILSQRKPAYGSGKLGYLRMSENKNLSRLPGFHKQCSQEFLPFTIIPLPGGAPHLPLNENVHGLSFSATLSDRGLRHELLAPNMTISSPPRPRVVFWPMKWPVRPGTRSTSWRQRPKLYMRDIVGVSPSPLPRSRSCTWTSDAPLMKGKKILIVDDVISTGESLHALEALVEKAGGIICGGRMAILAEGDAQERKDLIYLEKLPCSTPDGTVLG